MKKSIIEIVILALCFAGGFLISQRCSVSEPEIIIRTQVDTLIVYDTLRITEPVEVERVVKDTMYVEVPTDDMVVVHDTTYIPLPREYATYKDSTYKAVVSGFMPRLEEIEVYPRTQYITIQTEKTVTVKRNPRFSVGVQAGYGITPAGFQPYLGIGGQVNLLSF